MCGPAKLEVRYVVMYIYNSYFFTWQAQDDFYSTVGELCHLMGKYVVF